VAQLHAGMAPFLTATATFDTALVGIGLTHRPQMSFGVSDDWVPLLALART
jgi:hypothetical protein